MNPTMCPYCCVSNLEPTCIEEDDNDGYYCPKCEKRMIIRVDVESVDDDINYTKCTSCERTILDGELRRSIGNSDGTKTWCKDCMDDVDTVGELTTEALKKSFNDATVSQFNGMSNHEKWETYKDFDVDWYCYHCGSLTNGPRRAQPSSGSEVRCGNCHAKLTRRTGGGMNDMFGWVAKNKDGGE